jgi:enoyl-CoA hydratase
MTTQTSPSYRNLLVEERGAVTVLTVNRTEVLNALNRATLEEIADCVRRFADDEGRRALIVTGAGEKSFVSGADIQELAALDARAAEDTSRFGQGVFDALARSTRPVIAAVNGYAFGGGCELALACHLRLAAENAVFGLPEVGLGIIPGYGGTQRLPRLVGLGRALELVLTGRRVKADEAERLGLVNAVVPREQLLDRALQLAESILKNGPLAVSAALEVVTRGMSVPLDDGLRLESAQFGLLAASQDMHEGMKAFLEKRPAGFRGR